MVKFILFFIFSTLILNGKDIYKTTQYKLCTNVNHYPIVYIQNNQIKGIAGDIFKEIAKRANISYIIEESQSLDLFYNKIQNNQCDLILTIRYDQNRFKNIVQSQKLFYNYFEIEQHKSTKNNQPSIGVLKKHPNLLKTINKTFDSIPQKDIDFLVRQYSYKYSTKYKTDYELVWYLLGLFLTILSFMFYRNRQIEKFTNTIQVEKEKFQNMFKNNSAPMLLIRLIDLKIIDFNKSALDFYGYTKKEFEKFHITDINITSDQETIVQNILTEKKLYFTTHHKLKNKTIKVVDINSTKIMINDEAVSLSIITDITDRIQEHQDLLYEKNKFKQLLKSASDGVHILDENGNILECSDSFAEMLGYSKKEVKTLNVRDWDMEISPKNSHNIKKIFEEKTTFETKHKRKDGTVYTAFVSTSPVDINGKKSLYASVRDISELKQKDKLLLEQTKMAALGEMIGNIAHQWRQPLSSISIHATGIIYRKQMGQIDDTILEQSMETINDHAQYLSQTISTFQNFLKEDKSVDIFTIDQKLNESIALIKSSLKENHIELIIDIQTKEIAIKGVVGELPQVFINIINNAKDALKEKKIENPWIKIIVKENHGVAIITIEDNAKGIPKNILNRIFEPYFTTKHQSQGTGLGLHMSYKIIIESFKGKIYASNTQNGALFTIEIPIIKEL